MKQDYCLKCNQLFKPSKELKLRVIENMKKNEPIFLYSNGELTEDLNYEGMEQKICLKCLKEIFEKIKPLYCKNFMDFFVKINSDYLEKYYSSLISIGKTNERLINEIKLEFKKIKVSHYLPNPEHAFLDRLSFAGLPVDIIQNYKLDRYIGSSDEQGRLNGPDYIFKNGKKTIGLEIVSIHHAIYTDLKSPKQIPKLLKQKYNAELLELDGQDKADLTNRTILIDGKLNDFFDIVKEIKKAISQKLEKSKKYQKTNSLIIGLYLGLAIPNDYIGLLEKIASEFIEYKFNLNKVKYNDYEEITIAIL